MLCIDNISFSRESLDHILFDTCFFLEILDINNLLVSYFEVVTSTKIFFLGDNSIIFFLEVYDNIVSLSEYHALLKWLI